MNTEKILRVSLIFLLGFLSANITGYLMVYGAENPFSNGFNFSGISHAPSDFIGENQIQIYDNKVVINIKDASISRYAPTGSMKPTFDENANGIRIVPKSEDEIKVGDIITYKDGENLIVHRVIEKGIDKEGIYFIMKGDNNTISDGKVRFRDIKYKTIGIIW